MVGTPGLVFYSYLSRSEHKVSHPLVGRCHWISLMTSSTVLWTSEMGYTSNATLYPIHIIYPAIISQRGPHEIFWFTRLGAVFSNILHCIVYTMLHYEQLCESERDPRSSEHRRFLSLRLICTYDRKYSCQQGWIPGTSQTQDGRVQYSSILKKGLGG
ncbi:hypothetical protein PM082_016293 [Marasmius tenuissimus]|nr:hypothetical protein PM082_016293 [Marasmius tenuissimus]